MEIANIDHLTVDLNTFKIYENRLQNVKVKMKKILDSYDKRLDLKTSKNLKIVIDSYKIFKSSLKNCYEAILLQE